MLSFTSKVKILGFQPRRILHCGAHEGEEMGEYLSCSSVEEILWIEANNDLCQLLDEKICKFESKVKQDVINATIWSESDINLNFYLASNLMSSSVLKPKEHLIAYPDIKFPDIRIQKSATLDDLCKDYVFDYAHFDIQGAELEALKGFKSGIRYLKYINIEVNSKENYAENASHKDIASFLKERGFKCLVIEWNPKGWGDAFFLREDERISEVRILYLRSLVMFMNKVSLVNNLALMTYRKLLYFFVDILKNLGIR
jgi:FkbM family methyltransferase